MDDEKCGISVPQRERIRTFQSYDILDVNVAPISHNDFLRNLVQILEIYGGMCQTLLRTQRIFDMSITVIMAKHHETRNSTFRTVHFLYVLQV